MTATFASIRQQAIAYARSILGEKPLYLDTETTGVNSSDEIIEIAILDDDCNLVYESLVRPSQPIPAAASHVHGINDEMVKTARQWPIQWPTIRSLLVGRPLVIYNAPFDIRLMQQSHARYRLPWRDTFNSICAMDLYSKFRAEWQPARRSYRIFKLEDAGRACGISLPNAHRAQADTLLTRALLHYIAEQN